MITGIFAVLVLALLVRSTETRRFPVAFAFPTHTKLAVAAGAVSYLVAATPVAAFAADAGEQLFNANCNGCHAGGLNFMAEKKTLQKEALEKFRGLNLNDLDNSKLQLKKFVKDDMPHKFLPIKLTDQEYDSVVQYVLDQATGDRW